MTGGYGLSGGPLASMLDPNSAAVLASQPQYGGIVSGEDGMAMLSPTQFASTWGDGSVSKEY